jgi:hypothetical protein
MTMRGSENLCPSSYGQTAKRCGYSIEDEKFLNVNVVTTECTVQIHRGNIMRKMEADSFATLVKLGGKLISRAFAHPSRKCVWHLSYKLL